MAALWQCCCGDGSNDTSDHGPPYQPLRNDLDQVHPVRPRPQERAIDARGGAYGRSFAAADASSPYSYGSPEEQVPRRSKTEQQTDMLNSIIDQTQSNIIDVTHLEDVEMPTSDYIARVRTYEDAVKVHDAKLRGHQYVGNGASASPSYAHAFASAPGQVVSGKHLLEDSGNRVQDWLGRPPISSTRIAELNELARKVTLAKEESMQIHSKKQLVVFMEDS